MRLLTFLICATTLILSVNNQCYGDPVLDPIDDQYLKLKIDSTLSSDSIQRLHFVQYHLREAHQALNINQLDSAIAHAEMITQFDVNQISGGLLSQAYYIIGKANRINKRTDLALKNYLVAIQKLRYSDEIGYRSVIYQELGAIYQENGWISKSIEKYIEALKVEDKLENEYKQIELLNTIIALYLGSHDYNNAILYQERLLPLYSRHNMHKALDLMQEISDNYLVVKNYQSAVFLQSQILNVKEKYDDVEGQLTVLLEFLKIYQQQQDFTKLFTYHKFFSNLYHSQNKKELTDNARSLKGESLLILGDVFTTFGNLNVKENYDRALSYYDTASSIFYVLGQYGKVAEAKLSAARIYHNLEEYKSAIENCELAIPYFIHDKNYYQLMVSYELISESYMKLDKFKPAYQAQAQYIKYSDSLNDIRTKQIDKLIDQYKENTNRIAFQNLEQAMLQKELDTLSDELLHLEIEKQSRDIELLIKEKSINDLALKNEQLKNEQVTNENIVLQQQIEAELRERKILNLQADSSRQEAELKNQQLYQITNEQQIYALEQEKKLSDLQLQKGEVQKMVYLLSSIIIFILLISVVVGYLNIRKSKSKISAKNRYIEKQNKKLKDLNEEKNRLIRIVAHDLKNPLTSALTLSEIIYKKFSRGTNEEQHNISLIRRSLRRMQEMINKILDVKAIDSKQLNLEYEAVNVRLIVNYLIELFARKAEKKNISILNETEESYIHVDRDYFTQILENLISNALKFSPTSTIVRISTRENNDSCQISVADEGPGFNKKELKQLFHENTQLSPKPTNGESSNGLGLSIVKKYVEAMNGKVWCETSPGQGSTFYVEFEKEMVPA
jgi:signal transduction histidine kinase/tetratricopeptide (TPR) repeat protein